MGMNNIDEAINSALGLAHNIKQEILDPKPLSPTLPATVDNREEEVDIDYQYSRENFHNLVDRGQDAVKGILELAKESAHPSTYEVAGQLIKTVAEVTEKLADLQQKMQQLKEVPDKGPKNVTNALFVGSTKELQSLLKNKHESIESESQ